MPRRHDHHTTNIVIYWGRHWCRCLTLHNKSGDPTVQITLHITRVVTYKIPLWTQEIASHKVPSASTMKPLRGCYLLHPVLLNHLQAPFAGCTVTCKVRPEEQQGLSNGHSRNEGRLCPCCSKFQEGLTWCKDLVDFSIHMGPYHAFGDVRLIWTSYLVQAMWMELDCVWWCFICQGAQNSLCSSPTPHVKIKLVIVKMGNIPWKPQKN